MVSVKGKSIKLRAIEVHNDCDDDGIVRIVQQQREFGSAILTLTIRSRVLVHLNTFAKLFNNCGGSFVSCPGITLKGLTRDKYK